MGRSRLTRRQVIGGAVGTAAALGGSGGAAARAAADLEPVAAVRPGSGVWLGPEFWANRLPDWERRGGALVCKARPARGPQQPQQQGPPRLLRTVALLTRELGAREAPAHLSARIVVEAAAGGGGAAGAGDGFAGFLVGAGEGKLDWRAAALTQEASGECGGLLCVLERSGRVAFREHTDEDRPRAFAERAGAASAPPKPPADGEECLLELSILPADGGRTYRLTLTARRAADNAPLSEASLDGVPAGQVCGGVLLAANPAAGGGAVAFRDVRAGGEKLTRHPERALGPVVGVLYSLNGSRLKLTAQRFPLDEGEAPAEMHLEARPAAAGGGGAWSRVASATVEPMSATALFRAGRWDAAKDHEFRVRQGDATLYDGLVRRDPGDARPLAIGVLSCLIATGRNLDGGVRKPEFPGERMAGRFTPANIYFPWPEIVGGFSRRGHEGGGVDLLVANGDQIYEGNPTGRMPGPSPRLDYLYKWFLWLWAFAPVTRRTPTVVQTDDHDVYQGNLWGAGGAPSRPGNPNNGYALSPAWVNMVQRCQCGHNPDAFDPTPAEQGIGVYYGAFAYGGVSFAVLEDRKWKVHPGGAAPRTPEEFAADPRPLLGARQEAFLAAWADMHPGLPKLCLTQTSWATLNTAPTGEARADQDSNGSPRPARDRAVDLLKRAGVSLLIAGDQHLPSLAWMNTQGQAPEAGVPQFVAPAGSNFWLRWFEPREKLPAARDGVPYSGDWTDFYGNWVRVLAVGNPKVTQAIFRQYHRQAGNSVLPDRTHRNDGYGIVRVEHARERCVVECWRWDAAGNAAAGAAQFPGWPYALPFAAARRQQG